MYFYLLSGFLLLVVVIVLILRKRSKSVSADRTARQSDTPITNAERLDQETNASLGALVDLSLNLRLAGVPGDVLSTFDGVVDKLFPLLPRMKMSYPADELTFVVSRMSDQYLPDLLTSFTKLSAEGREQQVATLVQSLSGVDAELDRITQLIDSQNVNEFRAQAMFIRHKFFGESVEAS